MTTSDQSWRQRKIVLMGWVAAGVFILALVVLFGFAVNDKNARVFLLVLGFWVILIPALIWFWPRGL